MRRALLAVFVLLSATALAGCSFEVNLPSSAADATSSAAVRTNGGSGDLPGGAAPKCLVGDNCDDATAAPVPAGLVCGPLPAAMAAFDEQVRDAFPGAQPGSEADARSALEPLVLDLVDRCGYQVMVDVANQYPNPLYGWLRSMAYFGLGEISALPEGLRCAELLEIGLGPKQAVDYWFLWGAPGLMDADLNGIPCETVWPSVARYMPSYY